MKNVALVACLGLAALPSSNAVAEEEWRLATSLTDGWGLYFQGQVTANSPTSSAWVLFSQIPGKKYKEVKGARSAKALFEADCQSGKIRLVQDTGYSGRMGGGSVAYSRTNPEALSFPEPATGNEVIFRHICQPRLKVGESETFEFYTGPAPRGAETPNFRRFWLLAAERSGTYKPTEFDEALGHVRSRKQLEIVDCAGGRARQIGQEDYSGPRGDGRLLSVSTDADPTWTELRKASPLRLASASACESAGLSLAPIAPTAQ